MTNHPYPLEEEPIEDGEQGTTMTENVAHLSEHVVGRKIVSVEQGVKIIQDTYPRRSTATVLTLDNGKQVLLKDTDDCCAYTEMEKVIHNLHLVDHVITGVGTTEGFTTWHIYADLGDVVELTVGWSSGNPFYYGYGFDISVQDIIKADEDDDLIKEMLDYMSQPIDPIPDHDPSIIPFIIKGPTT